MAQCGKNAFSESVAAQRFPKTTFGIYPVKTRMRYLRSLAKETEAFLWLPLLHTANYRVQAKSHAVTLLPLEIAQQDPITIRRKLGHNELRS